MTDKKGVTEGNCLTGGGISDKIRVEDICKFTNDELDRLNRIRKRKAEERLRTPLEV